MKIILLLKHIKEKIVLVLYFKNTEKVINWRKNFPCSKEWKLIYAGKRGRSGHRYELTYSKFDECGKLHSKYVICYSKKESLILKKNIKEANPNYILNIKKLY